MNSSNFRLNQQFLDKSVQNADVVPVDFKNPEVAGRTITRWATQKTKGALKLNKIDFAPSTKIALTSALYFKGKFIYSFPKAQPGLFNAPGRTVQAEMMNMKRKLRYGRMGNSAEWVAIPYESSDSLVIILPHKDLNIDVLINDMSAADIQSVMRELDTETSKANVNITMPKFKLESTTSLIAPLKKVNSYRLMVKPNNRFDSRFRWESCRCSPSKPNFHISRIMTKSKSQTLNSKRRLTSTKKEPFWLLSLM